MPISLTIQKPNIRHFFVSGFAAALKPSEPFDVTFYKRWHSNETVVDCNELLSHRTRETQTVHSKE
jgi:hypothetical protein